MKIAVSLSLFVVILMYVPQTFAQEAEKGPLPQETEFDFSQDLTELEKNAVDYVIGAGDILEISIW